MICYLRIYILVHMSVRFKTTWISSSTEPGVNLMFDLFTLK